MRQDLKKEAARKFSGCFTIFAILVGSWPFQQHSQL
jgi:hypothetical protein